MNPDRVELLRASSTLTGIDFIQVAPSQTELLIFLQHDSLPAGLAARLAALTPQDMDIVGEGQTDPPRITVLHHASPLPPPVDGRAVLRLQVAEPGGFGHYRLSIRSDAIDPYFNHVRFSFKAACPSELDCAPSNTPCATDATVDFPVDYRARDFWSFRQALMDFASQRYPDWQDRLEADVGMMVLELWSALGDEFAYAQDRLARESRLDTATQRRSLRHLARLVDYPLDDGSGAFAWLDLNATAAVAVNAGTAVSDAQGQVFFEVGHGLRDHALGTAPKAFAIDPARNELRPHIWDHLDTCLPAGSTGMTLAGAHASHLLANVDIDPKGRWVLLQTRPTRPDVPERRLVVRLNVPRDGTDPLLGQPITHLSWDDPTPFDLDLDTLVLRGNLLPATSGLTRSQRLRIGPPTSPTDPEPDIPQAVERLGTGGASTRFLFSLPDSDTTPLVWLPANTVDPNHLGPVATRPEVELVHDDSGTWSWLPAMVGEETATPTTQAFTLEDGIYRRVVGFERMGRVTTLVDYASGAGHTVRFGDGEFGQLPADGARFTLRYRLGNGRHMNIAADSLVVFAAGMPSGVDRVNNPLAAQGGRDPESAQQIRINAPQAFRHVTHRAVQLRDHEEMAERLLWVQQAGASLRWTGSWPTVFVTADPRDAVGLSTTQQSELRDSLDRTRQAGREVKIMAPRYADIDLDIRVCVAPNAYRGEVKAAVLAALFGEPDLPAPGNEGVNPLRGFFDPDNFRFGTPLSRAALIATIQAVPGVKAVESMRVRRRGWFDWRDFDAFTLPVGLDELVRVGHNRDHPERGAVKLSMEGGA